MLRKSRFFSLLAIVTVLILFFHVRDIGSDGTRGTRIPFLSDSKSGQIPGRSNRFRYVDPLIGTLNGGHVFPGATLPFGMAKAVADVTGEKQGGFASDYSTIGGFSHMHDLGVGWMPSLGNFPIMPYSGCPDDVVGNCNFTKWDRPVAAINDSQIARPGYFAISLESGIRAEMTVSSHAALYSFTFSDSKDKSIKPSPLFLTAIEDLHGSERNGHIEVHPTTGRIMANATFAPSFGAGTYKTYVCIDFSGGRLRDAGFTRVNGAVFPPEDVAKGEFTGAWSRFAPSKEILVRVGMSFISNEQACSNAVAEIPEFDFTKTLATAEQAWEDKLSVVKVEAAGASEEMLTVFWTGIYRSFISPQDYTGENPLWKSDEPYFDSWYCLWDTFRTTHPLLTILDQDAQTKMVRSLIDIWRHDGHLPECRMSLCQGYTQGGSNADVVIADALLKNLTEGIDWDDAWKAVLSDAETKPTNWLVQGRGSLGYWRNIGYIPDDTGNSGRTVSRTVEYGYNDFCIAEIALKLGRDADADLYLNRSRNWENLWVPDVPSFIGKNETNDGIDTGFTGFLQPRLSDGTWGYQDPIFCSPLLEFHACYFDTRHATYEGSLWLYTLLAAPGDMASVIEKLGGPTPFVKRLDYFHESGILDIGDEQSFLTVFMYHYAGRPALSSQRVHSYIPSAFNTSVNGLPGNDDSGAMGAFATLSMMGLFPNAGQDVYLIIPPFFKEVTVHNKATGNNATIRNINFDNKYKNNYIQSATLNGKPYTKNWLTHDFFLSGSTLELTLGKQESTWGTRPEDLPPSMPRH